MNVRVQFYSHLRDLAGASELNVELADKATVGDLLTTIYERAPALRSRDKSILIGAGVEFVDSDDLEGMLDFMARRYRAWYGRDGFDIELGLVDLR